MAAGSSTADPPGGPRRPGPGPFRRILVAVDPDDRAESVLRRAGEFAALTGASMVVCGVVMRSTGVAGDAQDGSPADAAETETARRLHAAAATAFGPAGRDVPVRILHGDPAERLVEYAAYSGCDLIVLGPRPAPSLARSLRGSVRKQVAGTARVSVLLLGE